MDTRELLLELKRKLTTPGRKDMLLNVSRKAVSSISYVKPNGEEELIIDFVALIREELRKVDWYSFKD